MIRPKKGSRVKKVSQSGSRGLRSTTGRIKPKKPINHLDWGLKKADA